jgi:hypothetical protein
MVLSDMGDLVQRQESPAPGARASYMPARGAWVVPGGVERQGAGASCATPAPPASQAPFRGRYLTIRERTVHRRHAPVVARVAARGCSRTSDVVAAEVAVRCGADPNELSRLTRLPPEGTSPPPVTPTWPGEPTLRSGLLDHLGLRVGRPEDWTPGRATFGAGTGRAIAHRHRLGHSHGPASPGHGSRLE